MWWEMGLALPIIGVASALHLRRLASKTVPRHVLFSVWVSYSLAFSLALLVPLDLNLVYVQRCLEVQASRSFSPGNAPTCNMGFFRTWRVIYPNISDEDAIALCNRILRILWKFVWAANAALGWVLLTLQQKFEESRRFGMYQRIEVAVKEQLGFFATVAVLLSGLVVLLALAGQDLDMVFVGLMAIGNSLMLLVEALLLGYALAEYPISLWQEARTKSKLRRCLFTAKSCARKLENRAASLSSHLAVLYSLRKAASTSLRHLGAFIVKMAKEAPLDIEGLMLMDPIKGSSIPTSQEEREAAFKSRLKEVHQAQKLSFQVTEVDQWLTALESNGLLPEGSDVFAVQDALFDAGLRRLVDVDWLDPRVARKGGGVEGEEGEEMLTKKEREEVIMRQLRIFFVPDDPALLLALAEAVTARCEWSLGAPQRIEEELAAAERRHSQEVTSEAEAEVAGMPARLWTEERLVNLRTALYHVNRSYRKTKRKFDLAVRESILLQDLEATKADLMPLPNLLDTMWRAFKFDPEHPELTGRPRLERAESMGGGGLIGGMAVWPGFVCSVRKGFGGRYGLKLEAAWFLTRLFLLPPLRIFLAVLCGILSLCVLWSEASLAPWIRSAFNSPQQGSLLLHHVCSLASVPPGCIAPIDVAAEEEESEGGSVFVVNWVQLIVLAHMLYLLVLSHFSLTRLRLFRMYEIVPKETDANTLLVNAFLVCRLVPSICHNYFNMLHEANELQANRAETVFEETFSAMGRIPFVGSSFNDVLPPVLVAFFLLNLAFVLARLLFSRHLELFDLIDGEPRTFLPDHVKEAEALVHSERRSYDRMANLRQTFNRRGQITVAVEAGGAGEVASRLAAARQRLSLAASSLADRTAEGAAVVKNKWQDAKALLPRGGESERAEHRWRLRYEKTEGEREALGARVLHAKNLVRAALFHSHHPHTRAGVTMREASVSDAPMLTPRPKDHEEEEEEGGGLGLGGRRGAAGS